MISRKQFFASLGGLIASAAVAKPATSMALFNTKDQDGVTWLPEEHHLRQRLPLLQGVYREYGIYWTGWKSHYAMASMASQ